MQQIIEKIKSLSQKRILVIGDMMLDVYLYGEAVRISPEAPVPVVKSKKTEKIPGGAANVMCNLRCLGCEVEGAGFIGHDDAGDALVSYLRYINMETRLLVRGGLATIQKTRVLADGQHIVRYDIDSNFAELIREREHLEAALSEIEADVVVVSDYAKGTMGPDIMRALKDNFSCPIICDIKPCNQMMFRNVFCISPNAAEAREICGKDASPLEMARFLRDQMGLVSIMITLADKGLLLIDGEGREFLYPAYTNISDHDPTQRFDVTGAGDTVISVFAACVAAGMTEQQAAFIANIAAGIVVKKVGTATCTAQELMNELKKESNYAGLTTKI